MNVLNRHALVKALNEGTIKDISMSTNQVENDVTFDVRITMEDGRNFSLNQTVQLSLILGQPYASEWTTGDEEILEPTDADSATKVPLAGYYPTPMVQEGSPEP